MLGDFPQFDSPAAVIAPESRSRYMQPEGAAWLQAQQQQSAAGFMHDAATEQLLQSISQQQPSYSLGTGFDQLSSMYMPHVSSYSELVNHLTPTPMAFSNRAMLPALHIPDAHSYPHLMAIQGDDSPQYTQSSSPSSAAHSQSVDFALAGRFDGSTKSSPTSKRHSVDSTFYCRAGAKGRQRTAQACEKCRDRKTKVSNLPSLRSHSL